MIELTKEQIIRICESMSFHLDYDQWIDKNNGWMRFQLKDELDERDLRLIWYKDNSVETNLKHAANILFKAGQKEKVKQLTKYSDL